MAFASDVYTGNGSTTTFALTFPYVRPEHVVVFVNFVSVAYTYTNSTTVNVSPAPGNGLRVEVRRVTPLANPLVDFTDGSVLVAADLDTNALQNLFIEQELDDRQKASVFNDDATGLITAGGRRITAVANPTSAQDAATKNYVDTADALKVAKAGDSMTGALAMGANKITGMGDPTNAQDAATKTYVDATDVLKVAKAGDTMSGALAMGTNKITGLGTPTVSTDAATKAYVDTADALKVAKAGDSMTGALAMGTNKITGMGDPISAQDAATKTYVDTADALKVAKAGDSMTGALAMGTNKVTDLGTPTASTDAASKGYVDGLIAAASIADADYGDITVSGGGIVWTIDAGAVTSTKILDGTIVNADINASAAIAGSKIVAATTSVVGAVQLSNSTSTTSSVLAATPTAVKTAFDLADAALPKAGGTITGNVILDNQVDARFREATASGVNYVGFQAPANIVSDIIFTLPDAGPTIPGYALKSDSSGVLSWGNAGGATGSGTDDIFYENSQNVTGSYTLTANKNAMTAGPVTINASVTVTVPSGASWVVV